MNESKSSLALKPFRSLMSRDTQMQHREPHPPRRLPRLALPQEDAAYHSPLRPGCGALKNEVGKSWPQAKGIQGNHLTCSHMTRGSSEKFLQGWVA